MTVFRNRSLRALLLAQAVSRLGSQMTFLALPWFVLETTGSAARMGVVLAVELTPVALFGIVSGSLVARIGARQTLLAGDLARVPILVSVPLLHEAGLLTLPLLLVLVFLAGCCLAPYMSASTVVIPELVGEDEATVAQANAAFEGVQRATSLLGPPVAGLLIGTIGATSVLYVDAGTFLFSFLVVAAFVPRRPPLAPSEESRGVLAGVRFLLRDPFLRVLGITALFLNMFGQMLSASLLYLAREDFDSARVAGAFFAAFGAGAVVGSLAAMRLVKRYEPIRLGAVALLLLTAPVVLLGFDLPVPAVMLVLFASSVFGPIVNAPLIAAIMKRSPEALRAKVMSAVITCALVAGPVGLLVVGPLLADLGARPVLLLVALGQFVATLPFVWMAFRSHPEPRASLAPART
ncbi:MAG: MFS transporter [Gaiellaceae bacterium]